MRAYAHDQPERKGSELNDGDLLCLAPYADVTYVDKRTLESVRRAKGKNNLFAELVGQVNKAKRAATTRFPPNLLPCRSPRSQIAPRVARCRYNRTLLRQSRTIDADLIGSHPSITSGVRSSRLLLTDRQVLSATIGKTDVSATCRSRLHGRKV